MSEYVPLEIQVEIIKRLPVKLLIQFRSVSKSWKNLIDSPEFIAGYGVRQNQPRRLLVSYKDAVHTKEKEMYVLFVDDEAFTQQELAPNVPFLSKLLGKLKLVGSSQGLFCLYGYYQDPDHPRYDVPTEMAVLWNPSIRKSVCVPVPGLFSCSEAVLGFGVCPITNDPTIVKITNAKTPLVEVFTLSRGSWRIPSSNLPKKSIQVTWSQVNMGGFIYWIAFDTTRCLIQKNLILSFDLTTHEFSVINLPKSLADHGLLRATLSISKIRDSLAVLEYITYTECETQEELQVCNVWVMDHAVTKLFTKLFTVETQCDSIKILGFKNSGEPVMEKQEVYEEPAALVVYEPSSEHFDDIGIYGKLASFFAGSYMETLLLHDKSNCSVLTLIEQ